MIRATLAAVPTRKITAAAVGGAVATIVVTVLQAVTGAQPAPGLEAAFATIATVGAGYFVKESTS